MTPPAERHVFEDAASLRSAMAARLAERLRAAAEARGRASFGVGGGSFVPPFVEELKSQDIDWARVSVLVEDERFVPLDHADSNEGGLRRALGSRLCDRVAIVGLRGTADDPETAARVADEAVKRFLANPLDVLLLGMGEDGHTASLFPDAPAAQLSPALDGSSGTYVVTLAPTSSPHLRLSLTLPALLRSRCIWLHIPTARKAAVLAAAEEPGLVEAMPVRAILRQRSVKVEIFLVEGGDGRPGVDVQGSSRTA